MTITIRYASGDTVTLRHVEAVRLVSIDTVDVQCFGNDPVRHRQVARFELTHGAAEEGLRFAAPIEPAHTATIGWGAEDVDAVHEGDSGRLSESYQFKSREELDAFMLGVSEACGWSEYEVTFDSREPGLAGKRFESDPLAPGVREIGTDGAR